LKISNRIIKFYFGIILLAFLIWYFELFKTPHIFLSLDIGWIIVSALLIIASSILGALNSYIVVNIENRISFTNFLPRYWTAWAFTLVTPGQIGDIASMPAMLKKFGFPWHTTIGRTLVDKFISFTVVSILAFIGVVSLLKHLEINNDFLLFSTVTSLFLIILAYRHKNYLKGLFNAERKDWRGFIGKTLSEIVTVMQFEPQRVLMNFFSTWIKFAIMGCSYFAVFTAFKVSDISVLVIIPSIGMMANLIQKTLPG